jgi:hypothetical protein
MKWSGLVNADVAGVTRNLADPGTDISALSTIVNRYPFCSDHKATCFAIRTETNSLANTTAIVRLLRNGGVIASAVPPGVGLNLSVPIAPLELFAAGEDIEVQVVLTADALAAGAIALEVVVEFEGPRGPGGVLMFGQESIGGGGGAPSAVFLDPGFVRGPSADATERAELAPRAATIRNMHARHNTAAGAGSVTYTLRVNGVDTAVVIAGLATSAIGNASNLVNTVAVNQGDAISVKAQRSGGSTGSGLVNVVVTFELS